MKVKTAEGKCKSEIWIEAARTYDIQNQTKHISSASAFASTNSYNPTQSSTHQTAASSRLRAIGSRRGLTGPTIKVQGTSSNNCSGLQRLRFRLHRILLVKSFRDESAGRLVQRSTEAMCRSARNRSRSPLCFPALGGKVMMETTLECIGDCRASGPAQKLGVERCRLCIPRHLVVVNLYIIAPRVSWMHVAT